MSGFFGHCFIKCFATILFFGIICFQVISLSDSFCYEYYDFNDSDPMEFLLPDGMYGNWNPENGLLRIGGVSNSVFGFNLKYPARISFDWGATTGRVGGGLFFKNSGAKCNGDACTRVYKDLEPGKVEWQVLGTGCGYIDNLSIIYQNDSCNAIDQNPGSKHRSDEIIPSSIVETKKNQSIDYNQEQTKKSESKYNSSYVLVSPLNPDEKNYTFCNITNAIYAVDEYGTIILEESNYREQIIIEKPLTIKGSTRNRVILNNIKRNSTILIKEDNVTIENLTIIGDDVAVELNHSNNCRIINNTIDHSYNTGLFLDHSNDVLISNNLIKDCKKIGIAVEFSDNNRFDQNIIENCHSGISVYLSKGNIFNKDNKFELLTCIVLCIDAQGNEYPSGLEKCKKSIDGKEYICMFYKNNGSCPFEGL